MKKVKTMSPTMIEALRKLWTHYQKNITAGRPQRGYDVTDRHIGITTATLRALARRGFAVEDGGISYTTKQGHVFKPSYRITDEGRSAVYAISE